MTCTYQLKPAICTIVALLFASSLADAQTPAHQFSFVPASDAQLGGPAFDYRIGVFEVRNDQYVAFLNDALVNLDNNRGAYMFFDVDTGEVFIHSGAVGLAGQNGAGTLFFDPSANSAIAYNSTTSQFDVVAGLEDHPVTGVSWFGALKFCNWLTLEAGLDPDERVYQEAPNSDLDSWHPVTITDADWATRDLSPSERNSLLQKLGFRLPMDGGDGAGEPSSYNEWYKAAAFDGAGSDWTYGFGGNGPVTDADANYRCSGDPFEDPSCFIGATTPVGFYDGVNILTVGSSTADTNNWYGLYDVSGNVWEWMQDKSFDSADRQNRGGSYRNGVTTLEVSRDAPRAATAVDDSTGFRLVQSVLDSLLVTPFDGFANNGMWGGPWNESAVDRSYKLTNVTDQAVTFDVSTDVNWLTVVVTDENGVGPATTPVVLSPGATAQLDVTLAVICSAGLSDGASSGIVTILDVDDGSTHERTVQLSVAEPMSLSPSQPFSAAELIGDPISTHSIAVMNNSDSDITWSATWQDTTIPSSNGAWLLLNGGASVASSLLTSQQSTPLDISFDPTFLDAGVYSADVEIEDECTGKTLVVQVTITIQPRFSVSPATLVTSTGTCIGPATPDSQVVTFDNVTGSPANWFVELEPVLPETDVSWIDVTAMSGVLMATTGTEDVTVTINGQANLKPVGSYSIKMKFSAGAGEPVQAERIVTLNVGQPVSPIGNVMFVGPVNDLFTPSSATYTIQNPGVVGGLEWDAVVSETSAPSFPSGVTWWQLSQSAGIILNATGTDDIVITPSQEALSLPIGTYVADVSITLVDPSNVAAPCIVNRTITLVIGVQGVSLNMVSVPAEDAQPFGPTYLFRISKYEVSNDDFVRFLNDALVADAVDPNDWRTQYMVHDTSAGLVHLSDQTMLFDASVAGDIQFDPLVNGGAWVVSAGKERHPVSGVSWYGALKYCNWLTVVQGMTNPDQRAYNEGPTASDWYPITADPVAYGSRDLVPAERQLLAQNVRGFRLPMDDESSSASPYNEWYKAAAWDNANSMNRMFGFGRDSLTLADANYQDSMDPFDNGTTPIEFFGIDGTRVWDDPTFGWGSQPPSAFNVVDTENGYGLYDLTGNVAEWVQDSGFFTSERAIRGGHYENLFDSVFLEASGRSSRDPSATEATIGFRVVQTIVQGDLLVSEKQGLVRASGVIGGPFTPSLFTIQIDNPTEQTIDGLTVSSDAAWLTVPSVQPNPIAPAAFSDVDLTVNTDPTEVSVAPGPLGDFALVPGNDVQVGPTSNGPTYDFWISRTEVTNDQFVQFLNDARSDTQNAMPGIRSDHMFFDTDSGDVYIHDQVIGEEGTTAPTLTVSTLLYDASAGRIQLIGDLYQVQAGFGSHPVVGVSWYGAIKYCNWLSVNQGIPKEFLAYDEAPSVDMMGANSLHRWRPVFTDDATWVPGGVTGALRDQLIRETMGYRLPMDDEAMTASPYNEWYKAASFKERDSATGNLIYDAVYGFGRDGPLASTDANYLHSGDTEFNGTTPVRFFDGVQGLFEATSVCLLHQPAPTLTVATKNGYGLHDATGNVAEWMQDFGAIATERVVRGGSWLDDVASLALMVNERGFLSADTTNDSTGFRVVRGVGQIATTTVTESVFDGSFTTRFILDAEEPFDVLPLGDVAPASTLYGTPRAGLLQQYSLTNNSASDMGWRVKVNQSWLEASVPSQSIVGAQEVFGTMTMGVLPDIEVAAKTSADTLGPGEHAGTITFTNDTTGGAILRNVKMVIDQPVLVTSVDAAPFEYTGLPGGPFATPGTTSAPGEYWFSLDNQVAFDIDYQISVSQSWLAVELRLPDPFSLLNGTLSAAPATLPMKIVLTPGADTLTAGEYLADLQVDWTDTSNGNLSSLVEQPIKLVVQDWIDVQRLGAVVIGEPWLISGVDPNNLESATFMLTNNNTVPIDVAICVDSAWLESDQSIVEVFPGQTVNVLVSLGQGSLDLFDGIHRSRVVFENQLTGHEETRDIVLTIDEDFFVTPSSNFASGGVPGGPITPQGTIYTIHNASDGAMLPWSATVQYTAGDPNWILLDGLAGTGGTLADRDTSLVVVTIDETATASMIGQHQADILFQANGMTVTRSVSLSLSTQALQVTESLGPATPAQPGGPVYSYIMATFHTTNTEFVAFLNDALLNLQSAQPDERSEFMFFDTVTGDVYVNFLQAGEVGADPGMRTTLLFSPAVASQILYVPGLSPYQVATAPVDYSRHPATGISWYGAIKYCNWLTLNQGLLATDRCYSEASAWVPQEWRPVTIGAADWAFRELSDAERLSLVETCRGFRLPMDDGAGNVDTSMDAADAYNEWYKASAWDRALGFNHVFGFGRDALITAGANKDRDANHRCNNDPFEDPTDCTIGGSTPVGYFAGPNADPLFVTMPNDNDFGVFDMSGNVYTWVQDKFSTSAQSNSLRALRGGSWNDSPAGGTLEVTFRTFAAASATNNQIGLRVVRTVPAATADVDLDGDVDAADFSAMNILLAGPNASVSISSLVFDLDLDGDIDLADFGLFQQLFLPSP